MNEIWIIVAVVILFVVFGLTRRGKSAGSCGCAGSCEGVKKQNLQIGQKPIASDSKLCREGDGEARKQDAE